DDPLALVAVARRAPRVDRGVAAAGGLQPLRKFAPRVSLPREIVALLHPCHRLTGETFRLCVLATMRENASLHLPPEAGIDAVISGELSSAAGESFSFVEATEGTELAAEQAHVRSEETVLLSLLEPGTQGLEVT